MRLGRDHGGAFAKAHDVDAVGKLEHMRHVVADQDHGHAVLPNTFDQLHDLAGLLDAERGRRLVHDHDAPAPRRGARDRDALALSAREVLDRHTHRLDTDLQLGQCLRRLPPHRALVEHPEDLSERTATAQLASEEEIRGDVERRRDGQILVDRLDAGAPRIERRAEVHELAVEADLPLVRLVGPRQHLDQ